MSPKSRGRKKKTDKRSGRPRRASSAVSDVTRAGRSPALGSGVAGPRARATGAPLPDLQQALAAGIPALYAAAERFRPLLASDDLLAVEEATAQLIVQADSAGTSGLDLVLGAVALAARHPEPQVAAMACALNAFLPGMATGMALNDLDRHGVPAPAWRDQLGVVVPGPAWRYLDTYGDQRAVLATFFYGETGHTFTVVTSPWPFTQILSVRLLRSVDDELRQLTAQALEQRGGGHVVEEPMTSQELRGNLQAALYRVPDDLAPEHQAALDILRQRIKTLPPPERTPSKPRLPATAEAATEQGSLVDDTARARAMRDATVEAFLAATQTPPELDDAVLRFWARVLVGATAVCEAEPTHISPAWLDHLLRLYVPQTIELSPSQRAGLRPALTAWARWAAGHRELPAEAIDTVVARIAELDEEFDAAYADATMVAIRCYLRDIVTTTSTTSTVDGDDLRRVFLLRTTAVPMPRDRHQQHQHLLACEPDQREQILAGVLASWQPPSDSEQQWSEALHRVSTQLWNGEPSEFTGAVMNYLVSEGTDPLLLGDLTALAFDHASDEQAFLAAALDRVAVDEDDLYGEWADELDD